MEELLAVRKKVLEQQMAVVKTKMSRAGLVLAQKRLAKEQPKVPETTKTFPEAPSRLCQVRGAAAMPFCVDLDFEKRRLERVAKSAAAKSKRLEPENRRNSRRERPERKLLNLPPCQFQLRYGRGELPCLLEDRGNLSWVCPLDQLDYDYYLPIFVEGLRSSNDTFRFIASQGTRELLQEGQEDALLRCLPDVVKSLRLVLQSKDPHDIYEALGVLSLLARKNNLGTALVHHYRQLLSILNYFLTTRPHQQLHIAKGKTVDLAAKIFDTLEDLEEYGGKASFHAIKYMIPTYQSRTSCVFTTVNNNSTSMTKLLMKEGDTA